jgi:hypothetical protein
LEEYDYGARMYDPQIGRLLQIDPMAQKTFEFSPYSYVKNNPILNVDVEGKFTISFHNIFTKYALGQLGYNHLIRCLKNIGNGRLIIMPWTILFDLLILMEWVSRVILKIKTEI